MSRFSDIIHPSKKVTQRKIFFLTIYNTLGFVEERILPIIDDVIFVIVLLELSIFSEVGPSKKVDQYKISIPTIYNTLSFRAKKTFAKQC